MHDLIGMNKRQRVKNLDGQDLAIFVSYTGETKGILAYARVAQNSKCR